MKRFLTILHPTDFSKGSDVAFQYACELARDYNARLVVLHTQEPVSTMIPEGGLIPMDLPDPGDADHKRFDAIQAAGPGVRLEKLFREGAATATIVETAIELKADLIVMGTHGRTGLGRLVLGSVAEHVLRKAPCPVLTVKTDG